ncbi:tetratricopeptide repeat (TPR)-containing protein [Abeliophyllum distichum]|uniref:Tetratricopeptide repeat (TPR)-containing protein n=1 Tax=Abeliophyllum distichum TaxID=126358 RepID=A0ABD1QT72_9LAMI
MMLERMGECARENWQKQLAFHQLGCVMLERNEYKDAQKWFKAAVKAGHVYSLVGVARAKYKRGHKYKAYKLTNSLISDYAPSGWMYQERSLYSNGKEKMMDLNTATEMDPTLSYPYKYRAASMVEDKLGAAISEINKIIGFKVSPDCLELRAWFLISLEDYEGALRDVRALLTLDPHYMMFHGQLQGDYLVELLSHHVQQWSQADCWMQLYDRWSCVDDIGSLAVVHQMLANDPGKSLLQFRQSLLLLRLNCHQAAMRSLRMARNYADSDHERLIYEGWVLYDNGYRKEAISKAEESISIKRSFEAFFLKAYILSETTTDQESSSYVIQLLEEALRCPSDGLRKGQALSNLASIYIDVDKLDSAVDCYMNALNIKHTRAHQGLARVYHLKNQRKAAYDEMTKLIEKARYNASAYEKRSEYCDREMAKSDLSIATRLDPLRTYPYRYRAAVFMDDHKEAEAIAELTKAIAFNPDLQLFHLRAAFHDSMRDYTSTIQDCEAALCLDPKHADTLELYRKAQEGSNEQQETRHGNRQQIESPSPNGEVTENGEKDLAQVIVNSIRGGAIPSVRQWNTWPSIYSSWKKIKAIYLRQESVRYGLLAHFTANSKILEVMPDDAATIHIVGFDIGEGIQWPPLIETIGQIHEALQFTLIKSDDECSSPCWDIEETKNGSKIMQENLATARRRQRSSATEFLKVAKEILTNYGASAGMVTLGYGETEFPSSSSRCKDSRGESFPSILYEFPDFVSRLGGIDGIF